MKVVTVESWAQFSEQIMETIRDERMYPGVRQADYELIPKIVR